jgi:hypothetical protein
VPDYERQIFRAPLSDTKQLYLNVRRSFRGSGESRTRWVKISSMYVTYSEPEASTPDLVAHVFTQGGRRSVMRFRVKLKREATSQTLRAVLRAFDDLQEARSAGQGPSVRSVAVRPSQTFISRAERLARQGNMDEALDLIYDSFDERFQKGEFEALEQLLSGIRPADLPVDILLGILTATLPARTKLPSRAELYQRVEATLKERGEYEPGLLAGLEG